LLIELPAKIRQVCKRLATEIYVRLFKRRVSDEEKKVFQQIDQVVGVEQGEFKIFFG